MILKKLYLFNKNKIIWMRRVENLGCSRICNLYMQDNCCPGACLYMLRVKNKEHNVYRHYRYIPDVNKKIYNT